MYHRNSGYINVEAKAYCDALIRGASAVRKHICPQYSNDRRFDQYYLLLDFVECARRETVNERGYQLEAEVEVPEDQQDAESLAGQLQRHYDANGLPNMPEPRDFEQAEEVENAIAGSVPDGKQAPRNAKEHKMQNHLLLNPMGLKSHLTWAMGLTGQ